MANPFLGETSMHTPSAANNHYGDDLWFAATPLHVAALLFLALVVLTALRLSGFRAVVGIGRG